MKNLNVLLSGCSGHMGKEVAKVIENQENLTIVCGYAIEDDGTCSFPVYSNYNNIKENPDIIIDFSVPVATLKILEYATQNKIPIVIATTGFTDEQFKMIEDASKIIPVFQSYNMSFDIFLMQKILELVSPKLQNTDIEIIETHHNRKIDAPSGTALMLADCINKACDNKYEYNLNRLNEKKARQKNEIGFSSLRGGNIVGEHTVKFIGENDTFEITHKAYSRQLFAEGAVRAANFLIDRDPSLYNMNNML